MSNDAGAHDAPWNTPVKLDRVDIAALIRRLVRRYETSGVGEWRIAAEIIEAQDAEIRRMRDKEGAR